MIKKIVIGLLLVVGTVVSAEDTITSAPAPYVQRGVSITRYVDNAETWQFTNSSPEPFYVQSLFVLDSTGITNAISLKVVRIHDIEVQTRPDAVTTNLFGDVETNRYSQVTNTTYRVTTGTVHSATITNDTLISVTIPFMFKADDVLKVTQSDTNAKTIIISGKR